MTSLAPAAQVAPAVPFVSDGSLDVGIHAVGEGPLVSNVAVRLPFGGKRQSRSLFGQQGILFRNTVTV